MQFLMQVVALAKNDSHSPKGLTLLTNLHLSEQQCRRYIILSVVITNLFCFTCQIFRTCSEKQGFYPDSHKTEFLWKTQKTAWKNTLEIECNPVSQTFPP